MPQKPMRLKKLHKDTAIFSVIAVVATFLEDNPTFAGKVSQHVVSFRETDLESAFDNDHMQRLMVNATRVETLLHEKVQQLAKERVLKSYKRIKELSFDISKNHVNVQIVVAKI